MIKVYSTFQLDQAERLVDILNNHGIDAYVVDFSERTPGSRIGVSVHEIPTVFIADASKHAGAIRLIAAFDPSYIRALKESDIGKVSFYKVAMILGGILTFALLGGLLWSRG